MLRPTNASARASHRKSYRFSVRAGLTANFYGLTGFKYAEPVRVNPDGNALSSGVYRTYEVYEKAPRPGVNFEFNVHFNKLHIGLLGNTENKNALLGAHFGYQFREKNHFQFSATAGAGIYLQKEAVTLVATQQERMFNNGFPNIVLQTFTPHENLTTFTPTTLIAHPICSNQRNLLDQSEWNYRRFTRGSHWTLRNFRNQEKIIVSTSFELCIPFCNQETADRS